jgi:Carboxypeptidase regulatory-like domain/TonB dependent receptor/TonB-dependent Receptor Plug Domain
VLSDLQVSVQSQRPNIPLFLLEESMKLLLGRIFPVVSLLFLLTLSTHGVGTTGTLVGTVTDAKGGVISQAKVTVKNVGTNATRELTTSLSGEYSVPLLPPGEYEVSVERPGFKRAVFSGIKLEVDQTVRVDATLEIGEVNQQIAVTESAPLLQTDSSTVGQVIDQQKVSQLPLNERNFLAFTLLVPGAQLPSDGSQNSTQGGAISVNGAREQANNFLLDGVDNNDLAINQYTVLPSVDAIQEFKVQSSDSSAEYGRSGGAQINVVTKSGTNQFHGTGFEFVRNRHLDAKNFFDQPYCTASSAAGTCGPIPRLDRNQYGGTIGGPIRKDKTFFFGSYEGLTLRQAETRNATVPTTAERQEALADVPNPNPAGLAIFNLLPLSNVGSQPNEFVASPAIANQVNQVLGKVDHNFNATNTLSGEYAIFNEHRFNPFDPLASFTNIPGNGSFTLNRGQIVRIEYTHTFSAKLLNDLRIGFNRSRGGIFQQHFGTNVSQQLGFPTVLPNSLDLGVPNVAIAGFSSIGEPENTPQDRRDNTFHYADTLAWHPDFNGGRHQFKFGADIRRFQLNFYLDEIARGQWTFNGGVSAASQAAPADIQSLVDLLSGTPNFAIGVSGNTQTEERTTETDFFAQDDIRLTSRFTLNLGLRWEFNSPVVDRHNRLSVPDLTANALTCTPQPDCQFIVAGTDGVPRATYNPTYTNFAPRIGFAWRPLASDKFVVRAGYGMFYDTGILNGNILPRFNPPFFNVLLFPNNAAGNLTIENILSQTGATQPALPSEIAPNYRDGYVQQWNLDLQHEIAKNLVLDWGYVGSKGTHLQDERDLDQGAPGSSVLTPAALPFPAYGAITLLESAASSTYHAFQFRAEKRMSQGLVFLGSYTFSRSIDDASAQFGTAAEAGLPQNSNDLAAEKALSNFQTKHRFVFSSVYQMPFGNGQRWLNHGGLVDHIFGHWQASGILTLQSGKPFTILTGVDQSESGSINIAAADRPDIIGNPFQPGNFAANPGCVGPAQVHTPNAWFNPCAFVEPTVPAFGNLGRNTLIGPTFRDLDFSLAKEIPLGSEARKLQFRVETFNLANRPNFDIPNNVFTGATFSQIATADAFGGKPPRQIQLGLKFLF